MIVATGASTVKASTTVVVGSLKVSPSAKARTVTVSPSVASADSSTRQSPF